MKYPRRGGGAAYNALPFYYINEPYLKQDTCKFRSKMAASMWRAGLLTEG
jgi:hypothetical protein